MTPPLKRKGSGSPQPARGSIEAVVAALDTTTGGKKKKVSRVKKNWMETFVLLCKGHLEHLYARLDEEFDKSLSDGEGDVEVDTGSEGGRSTSSNWHQQGGNWKKDAAEEEATKKKYAAQLTNKLSAQAFAAAASGMPIEKPPGLEDMEPQEVERKSDDLPEDISGTIGVEPTTRRGAT